MKATLMFGAGDVRVVDVPDAKIAAPTDAMDAREALKVMVNPKL